MMRPNFDHPQRECNKNVTDEYFVGITPQKSNEEQIIKHISQIAEKHVPSGIYIGISGHPCGRFTGFYESTTPVPPNLMNYQYKNPEKIQDSIDEAAHCFQYSHMYLICRSTDKEYMKDLEQRMIEFVKEKYPEQVKNIAPGGEGDIQLEMIYLYVCISNQID